MPTVSPASARTGKTAPGNVRQRGYRSIATRGNRGRWLTGLDLDPARFAQSRTAVYKVSPPSVPTSRSPINQRSTPLIRRTSICGLSCSTPRSV